MSEAFIKGDFNACLAAVAELESVVGHIKLAEVYRTLCEQYLLEPPENFVGRHRAGGEMMQPSISLIIPAYNREKFIRAAIGSVLNQSRRDFELLVWDDGSTDATADAAEEAAKDDPRVRVVRGPHQGLCKSLNAAAAQLSSPYFGWVDSDDALRRRRWRRRRPCSMRTRKRAWFTRNT